ncbi:hypothetical protein QC761_0096520 [Podospora bellae-mahoneyi]|uniref:Uncharacterized protein n=1 Tax=Podospora bellae-mahoneyi TaxID=2093777 RepID=A0ABR0FA58_9PEZI|nr:hypothetical protein QC761_0096520 [Podospora bellae-mahoneyi]
MVMFTVPYGEPSNWVRRGYASETTTAQPAMFTIERGKSSGAIEAPKRSGALEPTKRSGALEPLKGSGALEPPKKSGYGDGKKVDEGIERPPEKT